MDKDTIVINAALLYNLIEGKKNKLKGRSSVLLTDLEAVVKRALFSGAKQIAIGGTSIYYELVNFIIKEAEQALTEGLFKRH